MRNISLLIISFLLFSNVNRLNAQRIDIANSKNIGHQLDENFNAILNHSGSILLAGSTNSKGNGGNDFYLVKVYPDYNIIWEQNYGTELNEEIVSMCPDPNGGYICVGKAIDFDKNFGYTMVFKISVDGKKKWEQQFIGSIKDEISRISQTSDGGFILAGTKEAKGDHDLNMWLLKLDKRGNMEWQGFFGERFYDDGAYDVIQTGKEFLIIGYTPSKDKTNNDIFLVKSNSYGNLEWQKTYPGTKEDIGYRIIGSPQGYLIAGVSNSGGHGGKDIRVILTDKTGNLVWDKYYGSYENENISSLKQLTNNKFLITGNGERKAFAYILDNAGNVISESYFGDDVSLEVSDVIETSPNAFILAGNSINGGAKDGYLLELNFDETATPSNSLNPSELLAARGTSSEPVINITSPVLNLGFGTVGGPSTTSLKGKVTDPNGIISLTINGQNTPVERNGFFEKQISLNDGFNDFVVKAKNKQGKEIEERITLEYVKDGALVNNQSISVGEYYALIFAVNDYADENINDLDNPLQDAKDFYNILTQSYNFETQNINFIENPKRSDMIIALEKMAKTLTRDDNLLIFYAGHGYWDDIIKIGYWLPSDAMKDNTANWLSNSTLRDFINGIPSKHTLLIADACFSGGIFKTRSAFSDASKAINKLYELPSRKAMTSGALAEVPDQSVFIKYLLKRLNENNQRYISSEELFVSFKTAVLNNSPNVPQYGEIKNTGDEGGDFIFIKK